MRNVISLLLVLCVMAGTANAGAVLVAAYDMDEGAGSTVADWSGNNRTGTINDIGGGNNWVAGMGGTTALEFNPLSTDNSGAVTAAGDAIDFEGLSLTLWLKNYGQTHWGRLAQFYIPNPEWCIEISKNDQVQIWMNTAYDLGSLTVPQDDAYHFVAVAVGDTSATIYVDDQSETLSYAGPTSFSALASDDGVVLEFGNLETQWRPLHGAIDDWRLYNGVLTAQEVADIRAMGGVPEPTTIALLGLGGLALLRRRGR